MQNVADNYHLAPGQAAQVVASGVQVQQTLSRVRMGSIAGVDHGDVAQVARQEVRRAGMGMPHHDHVHSHGLQGQPGVQQRFAFFNAAGRRGHVDYVGAEDLAGFFKRNARSRAGLVEQRHDHPAAQGRHLFHVPLQHRAHGSRVVQRRRDLFGGEVVQI